MREAINTTMKRGECMEAINIKRFSLAFGVTSVLLYAGCVFVMFTAGREETIRFFNSLMHGIDVTSIIRMRMPLWEMAMGLVEAFILGWLVGAAIAAVYNFSCGEK